MQRKENNENLYVKGYLDSIESTLDLVENSTMSPKITKYVDMFLGMKCAPDVLMSGVLPSGNACKEISESMAAIQAAKRFPGLDCFADPSWLCLVVGDGHTPKTGALFAFHSRWSVISVDPKLRQDKYGVARLWCVQKKVEDLTPSFYEKVLIVGVHSHALIKHSWNAIRAHQKFFINIPCCMHDKCEDDMVLIDEYRDDNILSPHNLIQIYRNR